MAAFQTSPAGPLILYASETGNAEDVAYSLHRQWNYLFQGNESSKFRIYSVEDYDVTRLPNETIVVFVLSTCGDGEFPIPMRTMWNALLRDSSYEKFNAAARKLFVRLQQLGGTPLLQFTQCLGDDQAGEGYLASLDPWTKAMNTILRSLLVENAEFPVADVALTADAMRATLSHYDISATDLQTISVHPLQSLSENVENWKVYRTKVTENTRLTTPDWSQAVQHLTFTQDIDDHNHSSTLLANGQSAENTPSSQFNNSFNKSAIDYHAGDVAMIYYANPPAIVDPLVAYFSQKQQFDPASILRIQLAQSANNESHRRSRLFHPVTCLFTSIFRDVLDIGSIPKRSYFAALAVFATNEEERDKLLEISSARGADLYYDYCLRERRNYTEVLLDFASVIIPLEFFIGLVPVIQPRPYSIASSPLYKPNALELCVAVVQRITPYKRKRIGLCSGFLASLGINDVVYLRIQRGSFPHFTRDTFPKHMLLIGPGTGIAPMRALLQDRLLSISSPKTDTSSIMPVANTIASSSSSAHIFFGCRRKNCDDLYLSEWQSINQNINPYTHSSSSISSLPILSSAHIAYSQNIGQLAKVYVTHVLEGQSEELADILRHPQTFVGIAGSAKRMPKDVKQSLIRILMKGSEEQGIPALKEEEAQRWLQVMIREKRLIVEAWG